MVAQNYKIENDGIWLSRAEIEQWRDHYAKVADKNKKAFVDEKDGAFKFPFYLGKVEVMIDLLKMFEPQEG